MLIAALIFAAALRPTSGAAELEGDWSVDLSTDPSTPYRKPMRLDLADDGSVTGSFYDSKTQAGRWKTQNGRTCVSFRTTDGVGPYHTAACRVDDQLEGQTWAEHRNFVFVWCADAGIEP